ncbi:MAG: hypothetical protein ABIN80_28640 [Dyadobacter sp.]|uniref:hypothetical protein n=1 Tax=Dyadobacter sp. TaxID=1914288 RepID=UPI003267C0AA
MDVKIIANVGVKKGYAGDGVIYAAKAVDGPYLFLVQHLEGGVTTSRYYRKSQVESGFADGSIALQSDLNLSLFTDAENPDFVTASSIAFKIIPTVTNLGTSPRLYDLQPAYTLKGEGVVTSDIEKLKTTTPGLPVPVSTTPGTTTPPATGALGGIIPADFSTLFSNPIKFVQDNMIFVLIVLGVIYFIRKGNKAKKPLWLF